MTTTGKRQDRRERPEPAGARTARGLARTRLRDVPASALRAAETRPVATLTLVGFAFALAYLAGVLAFPSGSGRIINGDAIQYFAYLQSAVVDGVWTSRTTTASSTGMPIRRPTSGCAAGRARGSTTRGAAAGCRGTGAPAASSYA